MDTITLKQSARPYPIFLQTTIAASIALLVSTHSQSQSTQSFSPPNLAQDSGNNRDSRIVITATRTPTSLADSLAQVTIISREDIDAVGQISLTELLQRRAGVEIRATGGPGQTSGVFIRGANATHTLVLIDGLRISSSTSGAAAFENIALDTIERIEVVKGPRSALYGSDAIGGVIQIFTRRSNKTSGSIVVGAGSLAARNLAASVNQVADNTTYTIAGGYQRIDAPSATNVAAGSFTFNPDRDPYQNTNGKLGVAHQFSEQHRLHIDVWQSRGKTRFDAGAGTRDTYNKQTLSGYALKSNNQFDPIWQSQLTIGETADDVQIVSGFPGLFKTTQTQASWQNDIRLADAAFTMGLESRTEKVASTTNYTNKTRKTDSLFGGITQQWQPFTFALNVRRDNEDQFGSRNTGAVSAGWRITPSQRLYASIGNAFRAPSFNDLYFPGFSNPLLQPEKSRASEIGWKFNAADVAINFALFDNKINNLIAFDFVTSKPQNVQRARIRGVELGADAKLFGIDWRVNVTQQSPENAETGKQLRSRAKMFGSIAATQVIGDWTWQVDAFANGNRFDSATEAPTARMSGYALLNASLRYRLSRQWQLELIGNNLNDRRYELAKGYNQLGRQWLFNVRISL
jgi:vitamin B12 transporter